MIKPYRPSDKHTTKDDALHERAVLCARLARLLTAALSSLDWQSLRFADRSRLARALMRLTSDARLTVLAAGSMVESRELRKPEATNTVTAPCSRE